MRKIGEFLLANDRNAIIVAFTLTLLPMIHLPGGFFAAIVVGFITLRKGAKPGLFVLFWVALPALALLYLKRFGVFDILLLRCIVVWLMALILRTYSSWRLGLEVVTLIAVVAVLLAHMISPDIHIFWQTFITDYLKDVTKAASWKLSPAETKSFIAELAPIATGIYASIILLGTFVQLVLARWWESVMFTPGRLREEFVTIRMGQAAAIVVIILFAGIAFKVPVAKDVAPVLLMPFMIAGLSLLHYYYRQYKFLMVPVVMVYMGLLLLPFAVVLGLALFGYIDAWVDFRKRSSAAVTR